MKMLTRNISRRKVLKSMAVATVGLSIPDLSFGIASPLIKRAIPSSGEKIGVVGVGTYRTFDAGSSESAREPLKEVLRMLVESGGSVIDSSPMYGTSEKVVGDLTKALLLQDTMFYATKVWTTGESRGVVQMESSMKKMAANPMDLMQIHNLQDWKTHLKTLYKWKEEGKIRYIGITHYLDGYHDQLKRIMTSEKIDFVQVNYSMVERNAENSLLPTAMDHGVGVIVNRPYAGGSLFRKVRGKEVPAWAAEFDCKSWGQFFLKYLLSNPAVTCVIPGTAKPHHMKDNLGAGKGRMPGKSQREQMVNYLQSL